MLLHEKISVIRKMNHLTQEAFAEELGVSRQAVSKWETGNATPDIEMLCRISDLYDVSLDQLVRSDHDLLFNEDSSKNTVEFHKEAVFDVTPYLGKVCDVAMNSLLFGSLRNVKIIGMCQDLVCFEKKNKYGYFNIQKSMGILVKGEEAYTRNDTVVCGKCRVYVNKGTYFGGHTYLFSEIESVHDKSVMIKTGEFISELSYDDISVIQMKEVLQ